MDDEFVGVCDICGEKLYAWGRYYEMPDGMLVCVESDCLEEWAKHYMSKQI